MKDRKIVGYLVFDENSGGFAVNLGNYVTIYKTEEEAKKTCLIKQQHSELKGHGRKIVYVPLISKEAEV
jgi:hypothetical protein